MIGSSATSVTNMKSNDDRRWTSVIEAVTATGKLLTPLIIFKAKSIQTQWFKETVVERIPELRNWKVTYSMNGWTSNEIAVRWLEKVSFLYFDEVITINSYLK